jgi:major membrane immunogen (membrane-anchored lipoprotein)
MKKISLFIVIVALFMLSACGKEKEADFSKTTEVKFHDLVVQMPDVFVKDNVNSNDGIIQYTYDDKNDDICMLYFAKSDYPQNDMKSVIQEGLLGKSDFTYSEKEINGNKWAIGTRTEGTTLHQNFYAINYNGKEYTMNYDDFGRGKECTKALSIIENSLKFN